MKISETFKTFDKFYIVFVGILIMLSVLIIITFKTIFAAYITAYEISADNIAGSLKVNSDKLNEAYKWVLKK